MKKFCYALGLFWLSFFYFVPGVFEEEKDISLDYYDDDSSTSTTITSVPPSPPREDTAATTEDSDEFPSLTIFRTVLETFGVSTSRIPTEEQRTTTATLRTTPQTKSTSMWQSVVNRLPYVGKPDEVIVPLYYNTEAFAYGKIIETQSYYSESLSPVLTTTALSDSVINDQIYIPFVLGRRTDSGKLHMVNYELRSTIYNMLYDARERNVAIGFGVYPGLHKVIGLNYYSQQGEWKVSEYEIQETTLKKLKTFRIQKLPSYMEKETYESVRIIMARKILVLFNGIEILALDKPMSNVSKRNWHKVPTIPYFDHPQYNEECNFNVFFHEELQKLVSSRSCPGSNDMVTTSYFTISNPLDKNAEWRLLTTVKTSNNFTPIGFYPKSQF